MEAPGGNVRLAPAAGFTAFPRLGAAGPGIIPGVEPRRAAGPFMGGASGEDHEARAKAPGGETSLDLLTRARQGDRAALDRLVARLLPPLRRWATHRLPRPARDLHDTDDLLQEAIATAVAKLGSFEYRGTGSIHAYVRQILLNRIRDELERARRRPPPAPLEDDAADPAPSPLEQAIGRDLLDRYEAALARLEEQDREAIVARLELGLPYGELAGLLGRPSPDAARMAVARALLRLAEELKHGRR